METNDISSPVNEAASALAKFEQDKLNRRAALRKIGLTTGMALFGMFAVDDLARVAVKKLAEHKETKAIADSIAHDFKDMGVAFAAGGLDCNDCTGFCIPDDEYDCVDCPSSCPRPEGSPAPKKKVPKCDPTYNWDHCPEPNSSESKLTCCQGKCANSCNARYEQACEDACEVLSHPKK